MAAAVDDFATFSASLGDPFVHAALVTPSDGVDLTDVTRGVSIGGAGAIKVTTLGGETLVIPSAALGAGVIHRLRVTRIWNTSTTATSIVAYW